MKDQDQGSKDKLSELRRRAEAAAGEIIWISRTYQHSPLKRFNNSFMNCKSIRLNWRCKTRNSVRRNSH